MADTNGSSRNSWHFAAGFALCAILFAAAFWVIFAQQREIRALQAKACAPADPASALGNLFQSWEMKNLQRRVETLERQREFYREKLQTCFEECPVESEPDQPRPDPPDLSRKRIIILPDGESIPSEEKPRAVVEPGGNVRILPGILVEGRAR